MTLRSLIAQITQQDDVNFLLTNRIPRQFLTRFMGWFSQIEHPLVCRLSIALWRLFAQVDLSDAKKTKFRSMHECFTRELKEGARPIDDDPGVLVSPCDAIIGAHGDIEGTTLFQAKGFPYALEDLVCDGELASHYRNGYYVTLRLTSGMYHRFHAPYDCEIDQVTYFSGDTWNVNPVALRRIPGLFCKNERAVLRTRLSPGDHLIALVPVAAVLVASIRLHFLDVLLHLKYRGPNVIPCKAPFRKGDELGWFQHGSTIIVLAPNGFKLCPQLEQGAVIRMGRRLLMLPLWKL